MENPKDIQMRRDNAEFRFRHMVFMMVDRELYPSNVQRTLNDLRSSVAIISKPTAA